MTARIAKRNGRPAYENAKPRQRGDLAEWLAENVRPGLSEPSSFRLWPWMIVAALVLAGVLAS